MPRFFLPDLLFAAGRSYEGVGLLVDDAGMVRAIGEEPGDSDTQVIPLLGKALLPGLANVHSHTFQRLFRGRAEGRRTGGDTFWTWREQMYRAAAFVSPQDVYDVARATFLEMLSAGITVVGEFHYLHNDNQGHAYAEPNIMAHAVIGAAKSVGIRICLLRSAYLRAGYQREPHPGQRRFYETEEAYLSNLESLLSDVEGSALVSAGAAPHSVRAVPLETLKRVAGFAQHRKLPLHVHISEQPAENEACVSEYGQTPVAMVAEHGVLTRNTTLVHAIHLTDEEFALVSSADSTICSCPTTERNLGDGFFAADVAAGLRIRVAFGTDSQAQIDILEDARQNEYHLRLLKRERGILDGVDGVTIGERMLRSATASGYAALGLSGGSLAIGEPADFFTASIEDPALLGVDADSLAAQAVFAMSRAAVRDVAVAGKLVITDGQHAIAEEISSRYRRVQRQFQEEQ